MAKLIHEIRDPIHVFVRVDDDERRIVDSASVQRLRHIHQLALAFLLYPGATHRRFEHSLGVMELAGRVYDVVMDNLSPTLAERFPEARDSQKRAYWRRVVRLAGLCHDLGHLPFSHAVEHELLPLGMSHETLSRRLIEGGEVAEALASMRPLVDPLDVVKVAIGIDKSQDLERSLWEQILNEIITGDAFGVDRMDYLLRDSHHLGVAYGRFDHHRLIDTLRLLPAAPSEPEDEGPPTLGVEAGGLQSAEALLLARYFMYTQVYYHSVRRIYDTHLQEFMVSWLSGSYPDSLDEHIRLTDNEVLVAMRQAVDDPTLPGHESAQRILGRKHFQFVYEPSPADLEAVSEPHEMIAEALGAQYGQLNVRHTKKYDIGGHIDFPVLRKGGEVASSVTVSHVLGNLPPIAAYHVFVAPELRDDARRWLDQNKDRVFQEGTPRPEEGT